MKGSAAFWPTVVSADFRPLFVAANRDTSSKPPRFIRHRRRFGAFPQRMTVMYENNECVVQSLPCVRGGSPQGRRGCQSLSHRLAAMPAPFSVTPQKYEPQAMDFWLVERMRRAARSWQGGPRRADDIRPYISRKGFPPSSLCAVIPEEGLSSLPRKLSAA